MLRMYLLQIWFNLSDPATEDAIYDSYAMRKFTGIEFMTESVPDETTLCKFRHLLEANGLNKLFFDAINRVMVATGHMMKGSTIVDRDAFRTVSAAISGFSTKSPHPQVRSVPLFPPRFFCSWVTAWVNWRFPFLFTCHILRRWNQ